MDTADGGASFSPGDVIEARYEGKEKWYPGTIAVAHGDGLYDIDYDDGDKEPNVKAALIRALGPVWAAAKKGDLDGVNAAIQAGASAETKTEFGKTPLHFACEKGHEAMADALIDKGANLEAVDKRARPGVGVDGWMVYSRVGWTQHNDSFSRAIPKCTTSKHLPSIPGHVTQPHPHMAHPSLAITQYGMTPLHFACEGGHEAMADALIHKGANVEAVDQFGMTALLYACKGGHETMADALIDKGANLEAVGEDGMTALLYACKGGHEAMADALIDKGANLEAVGEYGMTALLYACKGGHETMADALIDKGANLEAVDNRDGMTPLLYACKGGHEAMADALIDKGANVEAVDRYGMTALLYACKGGHETMADPLIDKGANLEAVDKMHGMTALLYACKGGHEAMADALIDKGANLEAVDKTYGMTALLYACEGGHES